MRTNWTTPGNGIEVVTSELDHVSGRVVTLRAYSALREALRGLSGPGLSRWVTPLLADLSLQ